jgi:hypothetical protein
MASAQHLFADKGVGVEQQHILARRLSDGLVVGLGKPQVVCAADKGHIGKTRGKPFHRPVF